MQSTFPGLSRDTCFLTPHLQHDASGYPFVANGKGSKSRGHRLAYRLFCGAIPAPALVLHACGNAQCVNPYHLYLGDAAQNACDRAAHGRTASGFRLPRTKLSEADVLAIRHSPKRITDIAKEFGISKGCASSIRSLRSRAKVQPRMQKVGG
ncbi:HNH endonuclease signature motif containing protein [Rhodoferax sp.]|uniref:HNH endonuclease signature motif containing protein n=1 Tax=Rhodoferax sp. TaxID=50421 RepID=UPI0025CC7A34|nr:HNH endonuclease signature motif containing protein [Rhodoferax sp.]